MKQPPRLRALGPPHNPGVRDLVANKRRYSSPPDRDAAKLGFLGWHERGYLPHRDEPGLIQFVTFRLADSFPRALRSEWEHLWNIEHDRQKRLPLEAYLDRSRGACALRQDRVAGLTERALWKFNGERYLLRAWCVMPNHVHVLVQTMTTPLAKIIESWKKHTAQAANRILNRSGAFWFEDYWDTYIRDADHERRAIRYIENNPVKAKLVKESTAWCWSSARWRNEHAVLAFDSQIRAMR
jgi:putative transposase